ncbi:glycerophosphodiester phosphodiesterase [Photorhabdus laumondii subsp. laumondii]|uniref:glycerophosphodiester phosphodiesterase n=2 Tax=Photorhabdus laumondii subsp. laumondii TaxID=141679 RepID=Q7MZY7_PHOLL|nr:MULTISPECIES: glycerophosphodiester phosphodiesterase [Photorhabdus]AWK43696.1 glycerophosphodiester phosphodiesterase [Photorhabdus laumondii subsp. laumondii]AXG44376.1 glycerophosphodiester phosphodiesterase [Photorhabdus laumondii subsp. laumondii]AXG49006.1 glycerophosphodiester phosphodiesterase [Photorhabdus laumondii subsp. laumondii]KTL62942.1 glycerophosphodiester phosphodiesterase [Photorhabdus laumondii subsp. laumondii]MCC8386075.1 glycerophosphodiester phosphodiesterase [Photo
MQTPIKTMIIGIILTSSMSGIAQAADKIVIAHRGASGYLPEHTLPAKAMAYAEGADYLEQDLVMTKDDELIVLHDHYLDRVTDVANKFPNRARQDGRYYAIDFTLSEIKSLKFTEGFDIKNDRQIQNFSNRFPIWKSDFRIHTFQEEIEFVQGLNKSTGKNIGIYPEIKAPWFHQKEGKDISTKVLAVLKAYGYTKKSDKIYLQCFDTNELKRIKNELEPKLGMDLKLVQLIAYTDWNETYEKQSDGKWTNYSYDWMFKPGAMKEVAQYADGIGPDYHMLVEKYSTPTNIKLTNLVKEAHTNNLEVHPYTIRVDQLPKYATSGDQLFDIIYNQAGVDGVFTDFPDLGVKFLQKQHQQK